MAASNNTTVANFNTAENFNTGWSRPRRPATARRGFFRRWRRSFTARAAVEGPSAAIFVFGRRPPAEEGAPSTLSAGARGGSDTRSTSQLLFGASNAERVASESRAGFRSSSRFRRRCWRDALVERTWPTRRKLLHSTFDWNTFSRRITRRTVHRVPSKRRGFHTCAGVMWC
jgi:hypothetical protein